MQEAEGAIPSVPTIHARVAQTTEHGASNAGDGGETPSASAIFSGCNVSRRRAFARGQEVQNQEVARATPATLTISDGWQSSNAPVPKTQ